MLTLRGSNLSAFTGLKRIYPAKHPNLANNILSKGGALVTEYDEEMEPYPDNITSLLRAGCNNLIKAGAIPVTTPEDILINLGWETADKKAETISNYGEEMLIIQLLQCELSDGAELLSQIRLDPSVFNRTLTLLEITGRIHPTGANHWAL